MRALRATCHLCDLKLDTGQLDRHKNNARCKGRQLAIKLRDRGLHPVETNLRITVSAANTALALTLFGFECELHYTRETGSTGLRAAGDQAWTTIEGATTMHATQAVSKLLNISFPEAARRLHEHRDLIAPFETARRLDGDEVSLRTLLRPIDYVVGSDGKKRPKT